MPRSSSPYREPLRLGRGLTTALAPLVALALTMPASAQQAIERHEPEAIGRADGGVVISQSDFGRSDDSPLGVDLSGVRLIGPSEPAGAQGAPGITVGLVDNAPEPALQAALQPYLHQPLSRARITQLQAAVARVWREAGYPFVSITVPPQEVTSGVLYLRVVEARFGAVIAEGHQASDGERLAGSVRTAKGDRIDAASIEEDVRWMARRGNRRIEAVFSPGDGSGESDLVLKVSDEKRWQAYGGWSNSGSQATGIDRYFLGAGAWIPEVNDLTFSYQLTGSRQFWGRPERIRLRSGDFPSYLGHAARIVLPTSPRQALEFTPSYVATRETPDPLIAIEATTLELPLSYRFAVSDLLPGVYLGELAVGVEYKRLHRSGFFGGALAAEADAELFQLSANWSHSLSDRLGRTTIDLGVTGNPGGVAGGNSSANWAAFSGGRVKDAAYAYASVEVLRETALPASLWLTHHLSGQLSGSALPDTERFELGGTQAVRGYNIDDGSADSGVVLRNELRFPTFAPAASAGLSDAFSSYAFFDVGHGRDIYTRSSTTLAGTGIGFDYDFTAHASIGLAAGVALRDAADTRRGDIFVHARSVGRF